MQFLLPSSINLMNVTVFSSLHTDDFVSAKWKNLFLRHFNFFFEILCISTFYAQIELSVWQRVDGNTPFWMKTVGNTVF